MPDNVRVMSYADNVLILGETSDSVEAANTVLETLISEHPCGSLRLKPSQYIRNITVDGLTFLGNDGEWNGDGIDWEPKRAVLDEVLRRIEQAHLSEREIISTIRWLRNWRRGYPRWKNGQDQVELYVAQLGARLAYSAPQTLARSYNVGLQIVLQYCRAVNVTTGEFPDLSLLLPDYQDDLQDKGKRPQFIRAVELRLGIRSE